MACIPCAESVENSAVTLKTILKYAPKYLPIPGNTWEEITNQLIVLGGRLRQENVILPK